jgi:hypothetical protein
MKKKYWGPLKFEAQSYRPACTCSGPGLNNCMDKYVKLTQIFDKFSITTSFIGLFYNKGWMEYIIIPSILILNKCGDRFVYID